MSAHQCIFNRFACHEVGLCVHLLLQRAKETVYISAQGPGYPFWFRYLRPRMLSHTGLYYKAHNGALPASFLHNASSACSGLPWASPERGGNSRTYKVTHHICKRCGCNSHPVASQVLSVDLEKPVIDNSYIAHSGLFAPLATVGARKKL